jgi:putative nucleotidyltransferase with HDIG domain
VSAAGIAIAPDVLRRQVERLRELPTLPAIVTRIAATLDQPDADLADAAALIETDQVLTARLLRLANSAFYGVSGQIGSVAKALTLLGTTITRSLLYSTSALDLHIDLRGFWEHSIGTAVAAGALAKHLRLPKPEEVSGAGLLHDLGKVVLCKQAPDVFAAALADASSGDHGFGESERRLIGVDHTEVAAWLLERWRIPRRLLEPVVHHHHPERATTARMETAVVHVANTLVRASGFGFGGDARIPPISAAAWQLLGLGRADLDRVIATFEIDLERALEATQSDV